ncbi:hypothetical protein GPECTOR_29g58 [Gonium pectorale]|uniref:Kinesin motor domain-containing protein n=1 Tax=Gonium pectorale TaxID=33097 RepID=A0A150GEJ3_GONPE|nr:hypothetical protein GPECTOR_29g58 [Gonium pectorale]|eukprot:KXZ48281.1 hypothetical protein GPECTOR_29g58 [Gonium pectorale]
MGCSDQCISQAPDDAAVRASAGGLREANNSCVHVSSSQRLEVLSKDLRADIRHSFEFDCVLPWSCSQLDVFQLAGMAAVDNCLSGYSATIFAYGQTGAGKTHTMIGAVGGKPAERGLAPRSFEYLFNKISHEEDAARRLPGAATVAYSCSCSFLELYNDRPRDLLRHARTQERSGEAEALQIREHPEKGPYVEGLTELPALNGKCPAYARSPLPLCHPAPLRSVRRAATSVSDEMLAHLLEGVKNRRTCATERNAASSRSHAIFAISITKRVKSASGAVAEFSAKLNLVDLAGSERASGSLLDTGGVPGGCLAPHPHALRRSQQVDPGSLSSLLSFDTRPRANNCSKGGGSGGGGGGGSRGGSGGGQDERLRETCGINSSLAVLRLVIAKLNDAQRAARSGGSMHVPYRDSKLTYLLKESLGGNAKTFFIANVSPSTACAEETLSTLRFARDARAVRNAARVAVTVAGDRAALQREVEALRAELTALRAGSGGSSGDAEQALALANRELATELEKAKQAQLELQAERDGLRNLYSQARRQTSLLDRRFTAATTAPRAALERTVGEILDGGCGGAASEGGSSATETDPVGRPSGPTGLPVYPMVLYLKPWGEVEVECCSACDVAVAAYEAAWAAGLPDDADVLEAHHQRCSAMSREAYERATSACDPAVRKTYKKRLAASLAGRYQALRAASLAEGEAGSEEELLRRGATELLQAASSGAGWSEIQQRLSAFVLSYGEAAANHRHGLVRAAWWRKLSATFVTLLPAVGSKAMAALGERCGKLASEVADARSIAEAARRNMAAERERAAVHVAEAAEARTALLAAQQASAELERRCAELAAGVADAQAAAQAARRDAEAERERSAALAAKAAEAEAALGRAQAAVSGAEERSRQLTAQVAEAQASAEAARQAAAEERERRSTAARSATAEAQADLNAAQQASPELQQRCEELASQVASLQSAERAAQQLTADLQKRCEDFAMQVAETRSAAMAVRREFAAERERASALASEAADLRSALSTEQLAVTALKARCRQLLEAEADAQTSAQAARCAAALSDERSTSLAAELEQARAELAAALAESQALMQGARRDAAAEGERAVALTSEVAQLRAALAASCEATAVLEARCGGLEREAAAALAAAREAHMAAAACEESAKARAAEAAEARADLLRANTSLQERCSQLSSVLSAAQSVALAARQEAAEVAAQSAARAAAEAAAQREAAEAKRQLEALQQQLAAAQEELAASRGPAGGPLAGLDADWGMAAVEAGPAQEPLQKLQACSNGVDLLETDSDSGGDVRQDCGDQMLGLQAERAVPAISSVDVPHLQRRLCSAAESNDLERLRQLLLKLKDHGGPNTSNHKGETPLHFACARGNEEVVLELLSAGARVDAKTKAQGGNGGHTPLHLTCRKGHAGAAKRLLELRKNLDINAQDASGNTALHLAAEGGHRDVVHALLKAGARTTTKNKPLGVGFGRRV